MLEKTNAARRGDVAAAHRSEAEIALQEHEWRLRYAMESAGLTYVEVDLARGQARTAENFAAVMGYPSPPTQEDDVAAGVKALLEHVVPHDRARVASALRDFTSGLPVGRIDYRVLGDDGTLRWIESRWSIQSGADGKPQKMFATNLDITERRLVAEALRASEERCRLALDSAELGTFNIDSATNILTTDDRFRAIFGAPAGQIEYEQAFTIVHPDDRASLRAAVAAATRADDPAPFAQEYRIVHPDGAIRWIFARGRANSMQEGTARRRPSFDGTVADITERKLADVALREIEAFNRSIVDSSPDCIKVLDLDGNLLSMQNGLALLGIEDIRPFLNKSWTSFWKGADRAASQAAVAAAAAGRAGRFVGFFRTLRGEPKWWDVSISPILDAAGTPVRLLAVSRDVTQRKWAETNLELLASVSDDLARLTSVDKMMRTVGAKLAVHLDLSLCAFVEVDEAADQVVIAHEWHRDDVPGIAGVYRLADFVDPEFIRLARGGEIIVVRDTAADPVTDAEKFAALKIASFLCVPLLLNGQWRFALCLYHSQPYHWRSDEIEVTRELTTRIWMRLERLRSEAELRESEKRYRTLFESIDEGFCIIEKVEGEDGAPLDFRYVEANLAFEVQSGVRDVVGKTIRQVFPGVSEDWYATYDSVLTTGTPIRFERDLAPAERVLELYVFRLEPDAQRRVAIIFKDVTARNLLQRKAREQAEVLVDLDRRKDEFLAMLSHELRNPLAPISNALLLLRLQKNEDPIQQQARGVIERQVAQLKHLIDDLLEVSRISTGRVHLRQERVALGGIVERAVESAQALIAQHRHELTVSLPPQPIWLHADAARLEQVVVNILTNAAKYTDDGGRIAMSLRQEGDAAVLRVRDTGVGISAELLPHIFDLFTQGERSLDRSQGGLGIGLCLVQRLVELHGGTVSAKSVLGQGSEFVVRLPAVPNATAPARSLSGFGVVAPETRCRVLVVDDNVDAAQVMAAVLELSGHEVGVAFDGPSGLQAAIDQRPDVILLDIGLPGLSGIEVAEVVRRQPTLERVVLVAMTGYGQESDRKRSREAGFDHHLTKPADFAELEKILAASFETSARVPLR